MCETCNVSPSSAGSHLLQVEAQLGASRERASELAWQLAEAEERARAQVCSQQDVIF